MRTLPVFLLAVGLWATAALASQPASRVQWRAVPGGVVTLGTAEGRPDQRPPHQVELPPFRIMVAEATVAQYGACLTAGACPTPRGHSEASPAGRRLNWGAEGRELHPINGITWAQAKAFCTWAGGRLPSEAEWARAARDRHQRLYPWGSGPPAHRAPRLANVADLTAAKRYPTWPTIGGYDDGFVGTAPVGTFNLGRSPFGLVDMSGNVWEWTSDRYDPEGYRRPKRPGAPNLRAARGGSFTSPADRATTHARRGLEPHTAADDVGVRCVAAPR